MIEDIHKSKQIPANQEDDTGKYDDTFIKFIRK